MQKQLETKEAERDEFQKQVASLHVQNEEKEQELVATQKQVASLLTPNDAKQGELDAFQARVEALLLQNTNLGEQIKSLIQQLARMEQEAATTPKQHFAGMYQIVIKKYGSTALLGMGRF